MTVANNMQFRRIAAVLHGNTDESLDNEATRALLYEVRSLLQMCKVVTHSIKASRTSSCHFYETAISLPLGAKDFTDRMAQLYVSHFESVFRILHIPSFWTEYEKYWSNTVKVAAESQLKIQLVAAIGSSLAPGSSHDPAVSFRPTACHWVHAAQNWLSVPAAKDRLSISGLQVQCLLILARQALSIGGDLIWIGMGTDVRTAMQMGLHRDPKHFQNMTGL